MACRRAAYDKTGSIDDAEELTDDFKAMYEYFKSQFEEVCIQHMAGVMSLVELLAVCCIFAYPRKNS